MSGLTVFFKDFVSKENNAVTTYDQSTAAMLLLTEDENEKEDSAPYVNEWTEPLSYKDWKNLEKQVLNTYLQHRVLVYEGKEDEEEEEEEGQDPSTSHDGNPIQPSQGESGYSQELETQGYHDLDDKKSETLPHRPPHINDAIHTVEYLTDVDLRSKQTNLKLLKVDRYWQHRKTNRTAASNVVPRRQPVIEIYQGPLKIPLSPCEDDGPLNCIYRSVLSMEVSQVNKPTSNIRQRATAVMQQEVSVHRMKLFLYNGYADTVNSILTKLSSNQRLLLQLEKVPPQCIFPLGMTSWVDCDLSQYCICVGDKSKLILEDENGLDNFLRFDAPEMELSAAIVEGDKEIIKEYRILHGGSKLVSEEVLSDDRVLGPAYVSERRNHGSVDRGNLLVGFPAQANSGPTQETPQTQEPSAISQPELSRATSTENNWDGNEGDGNSKVGHLDHGAESSKGHLLDEHGETRHDITNGEDAEVSRAINPESQDTSITSDVHQMCDQSPTPTNIQIKESPRPPGVRVEDGTGAADNADASPECTDIIEPKSQRDETVGNETNSEQMGVVEKPKPQQDFAEMVESVQQQRLDIPHEQNGRKQPGMKESAVSQREGSEQQRSNVQGSEMDIESQQNGDINKVTRNEDGSDIENDESRQAGVVATAPAIFPPLSTVNNNQVREDLSFRVVYNQGKGQSPLRQGKKPRETYHYHRLGDLRAHLDSHKAISKEQMTNSACTVNVFGIVIGFGHPSQTKRGDWMVSVALVDDSLPLETESSTTDSVMTVNVNIFVKEDCDLPKLRFAGDVLRLHRVKLQEWNNEIQLLGMRSSSYVVCCREGMEVTLYPTSTSFTLSEQEKRRFTDMWKWGQHRLYNYHTMKTSVSFKLSDMYRQDSPITELYHDENSRGDLTAMVTGIILFDRVPSYAPVGFLRVWDGTGVPVSDPVVYFDRKENKFTTRSVTDGDPPSEALIRLAHLVRKISSTQPNKPPLREPHTVTGRVVNVAIWDSTYWDSVEEVIRVGTFVRLRNILDNKLDNTDIRCLHVHSKSHMTPLPEMTFEVIRLLEDHNARLERGDVTNPSSGILPLEESDNPQKTTLLVNSPRVRETSPIRRSPKRRKHQPSAGFASLLTNDKQSSFTGDVNIVGTVPAFPILARGGIAKIISARHNFAVKLEDNDLNQIDAIVNGRTETALKILGCGSAGIEPCVDRATEFLRTSIKKRWRWNAQIRSVMLSGSKYFVLDTIKQCDAESD